MNKNLNFFGFDWIQILICVFLLLAGMEPSPPALRPFIGLLYETWMIECDDGEVISELIDCQVN
jgi:hypothetical protein